MFEFQSKGIHFKDQIQANLKVVYKSFDMNLNFLQKLNFDTSYSHYCKSYCGRLWLRELMIRAQSNIYMPTWQSNVFACAMIMNIPLMLALMSFEKEKLTLSFWLISIIGLIILMMSNFPNMLFLQLAFNETRRRNAMMSMLSSSLELEFIKKNAITVRMPTINFLCPETLLVWIEARKIVLDVG